VPLVQMSVVELRTELGAVYHVPAKNDQFERAKRIMGALASVGWAKTRNAAPTRRSAYARVSGLRMTHSALLTINALPSMLHCISKVCINAARCPSKW
jgi:hypothetical protein